jgi:hypothetical protein
MNSITKLILISLFLAFMSYSQNNSYWDNAPTIGTKIYSIEFIDTDNGWAKSKLGEVLKTIDGGAHWIVNLNPDEFASTDLPLWTAEIYCSVMNTTDGGITWSQYTDELQDHFCQVYFKNENTGWKTSEEFLHKVVSTINSFINKNDLETLYTKASQCTEYYTDMNSGWALGWCVKNYKSN